MISPSIRVLVEHDVSWLDVTVGDTVLMQMTDTFRNLTKKVPGLFLLQTSFLDNFGQQFASVHELHDEFDVSTFIKKVIL